ncbi:MAG: nuclear transport factor 2 family protein [Reyranellaceae bacterium]
MTSRSHIENTLRSLYVARVKDDLEGTVKDLAEDVVFGINGRGTGVPSLGVPVKGKPAAKAAIGDLIAAWKFADWTERSLMVDGERAMLHWTAHITFVPTGKSETFEVCDIVTFRDGKIIEFRQNTDTAQVMALTVA